MRSVLHRTINRTLASDCLFTGGFYSTLTLHLRLAQVKVHVSRLLLSTIWKSEHLPTPMRRSEIPYENRPNLEKIWDDDFSRT